MSLRRRACRGSRMLVTSVVERWWFALQRRLLPEGCEGMRSLHSKALLELTRSVSRAPRYPMADVCISDWFSPLRFRARQGRWHGNICEMCWHQSGSAGRGPQGGHGATACRFQTKQPRPVRAASSGWCICARGPPWPTSQCHAPLHHPIGTEMQYTQPNLHQWPNSPSRVKAHPLHDTGSLESAISRFGDAQRRHRSICENTLSKRVPDQHRRYATLRLGLALPEDDDVVGQTGKHGGAHGLANGRRAPHDRS